MHTIDKTQKVKDMELFRLSTLTLITGAPGVGKSLLAKEILGCMKGPIFALMDPFEKNEFEQCPPVEDWNKNSFKPGSVVLVDEAQRHFFPGSNSVVGLKCVLDLGINVILIAQESRLVDSYIREMEHREIHLIRRK